MQLCAIRAKLGKKAGIHSDGLIYCVDDLLVAMGSRAPALDSLSVCDQIMTIAQSPSLQADLRGFFSAVDPLSADSVVYAVPVSGPVIGVGRNYQDHVNEGGLPTGEYPKLFFKHPNSLAAHGENVLIPKSICKADWEAELGVIIGKEMSRVSVEDALSFVAGFINVNDVSAREFQFDFGPAQTSFAKSMDGFCPVGPWLVTSDEIADCQNLTVRCEVNGVVKQDGHTAYMIYTVAQILSHISQFMTLRPGYLIATGTPLGVGHFQIPPQYLDDSDVVRVAVQGLGVLENRFVRER